MNLIHRLRNKPEHVKNRMVIIGSIICTLVIVIIWIVVIMYIPKQTTDTEKNTAWHDFIQTLSGLISVVKQADVPALPKPEDIPEPVESTVPVERLLDAGLNPA